MSRAESTYHIVDSTFIRSSSLVVGDPSARLSEVIVRSLLTGPLNVPIK